MLYRVREEEIAAVLPVTAGPTLGIHAYTTNLDGRFGIRTRLISLIRTDNTVSPPVNRIARITIPRLQQWNSINTNNNFTYAGFVWRVNGKQAEAFS